MKMLLFAALLVAGQIGLSSTFKCYVGTNVESIGTSSKSEGECGACQKKALNIIFVTSSTKDCVSSCSEGLSGLFKTYCCYTDLCNGATDSWHIAAPIGIALATIVSAYNLFQ